jgi:glycosyltransferase involved in cell wall biosynthesis
MTTPILLTCQFSAAYGGVPQALLDLVRHLDRTRFDPIVLCSPEGELPALIAGANAKVQTVGSGKFICYSHRRPLKTLCDLYDVTREIIRLTREEGVRIVHTYDGAVFFAASLAKRFCKDLQVIWLDSGFEGYYPAHFRLVMRWCFRGAARVTSATYIRRRQLLAEGLDPAQSAVVPFGTDFHLRPGAAEIDRDAQEPLRVGIVGRITPVKNFEMFLRAARLVADKRPQVKFEIVGAAGLFGFEEIYHRRILDLIDELDLKDHVVFHQPQEDLSPLLRSFDVLACSSHIETFGRTLVEAMALGIPVVATAVGGIPEVIADGETGFLVPSGDVEAMASRLNQLLGEPELRAEMGRKGFHRVLTRFDIRSMARQWERMYEELLT